MAGSGSSDVRNNVIAGVITAGVVAAVTLLFSPEAWIWAKGVVAATWRHLAQPVSVPMWLLYVGGLVLLLVVVVVCAVAIDAWRGGAYRTDSFFGVVWRWDWPPSRYAMHAFCPLCDTQLGLEPFGMYDVIPRTALKCSHCAFDAGSYEGNRSDLRRAVLLQVQRHIRAESRRSAGSE